MVRVAKLEGLVRSQEGFMKKRLEKKGWDLVVGWFELKDDPAVPCLSSRRQIGKICHPSLEA